jgi:ADP-heptose:LPS heptosyltransferase
MASLTDYITLIDCCDGVVSTDTGTVHLAEALGKPALVLYGPTRDDLWIRYYRKALPLRAEYSGKTCRSPCGRIKNTEAGCPEAILYDRQYSPCLLSIPEAKIVARFSTLLQRMERHETTHHFGVYDR